MAYLDRRVVGSFITMTSVISPYLLKYSRRLSATQEETQVTVRDEFGSTPIG